MIILVRIILDIHLAIFGIHRNQVNPLFRSLWINFYFFTNTQTSDLIQVC